jgi:hypothetical protein
LFQVGGRMAAKSLNILSIVDLIFNYGELKFLLNVVKEKKKILMVKNHNGFREENLECEHLEYRAIVFFNSL